MLTRYRAIVGTIAYMAPEQVRGDDVDARADIYSAGCILFQLLSGRLPFDGDVAAEVIHRICEEEAPSLSALAPDLPQGLVDCVARCLKKKPSERYANVQAVLADLEAVTDV